MVMMVTLVTLVMTLMTSSTSLNVNGISMATPGTRGRYYSRTADLMTELTVAMPTTTTHARWCCHGRWRWGRRWKSPRARGRRRRG